MPQDVQRTSGEYNQKVKERTRPKILRNVLVAFLVGGSICLFGQILNNSFMLLGADEEISTTLVAITLILIGGVVTGLGWYDELGQFAGAGAAVPITGFANAVVSAAMEHRQEGLILGVGAKMYSIAGPVLTYGVVAAFTIGLIKTIF